MGRMLDLLRNTGRARPILPITEAPRAQPVVEEVPYIEVGVPGSFEASPSVLDSKPRVLPLPVPANDLAGSAPRCGSDPGVEPRPTILSFKPMGTTAQRGGAKPSADLVLLHRPDDPLADQYRNLMEQMTPDQVSMGTRVMLFTPSARAQDSTNVLLNLAICHARDGQRVLIMDARPSRALIARQLGIAEVPGLREILGGIVTWTKAIQPTSIENLSVIAAGSVDIESGSWIARKALWALLRQLRKRYDIVLIDAPTWHGGTDLMALGSACDEVYLVLDPDEIEDERTADLMARIPRQGGRLQGCIIAGTANPAQ